MNANNLAQSNKLPRSVGSIENLQGVIVGGGWEHDAFGNPRARVEILLNAHHITLIDDTERGWTLEEFNDAPNPEEEFKKVFGVELGEDAEFDYAVLRDFVRMLECVGSERIAELCGGRPISLEVDPRVTDAEKK